MPVKTESFTIGVEEEYLIVDPTTRAFRAEAKRILSGAQKKLGEHVQPELQLSQIEVDTPICHTLAGVRAALTHLRKEVLSAALQANMHIAATATHPFTHWKDLQITPKDRYRTLARDFQQLTREQGIQGCHVHIGISDREHGVQIMNHVRNWLVALLALSANSPFWLGEETGYASYRTEIWTRWPMSGPPQLFETLAAYNELVQTLIATRSLDDATKIYWDLRLSERFSTIEFRVADVCMSVDEAVMIAGLARALVRSCDEQAKQNRPFPAVRQELLRISHWNAARYGLEGELIDVLTQEAIPAAELIGRLLTFVRPALEEEGDWEEISSLVEQTLWTGNGAMRQRQVYLQTGRLEGVVDFIVAETARGVMEL